MSNILLDENNGFVIKNSHTDKEIPFLYSGEKAPEYVMVSEEEIPSVLSGRELTQQEKNQIPGVMKMVTSGGKNDWGEPLDREDFVGSHLIVENLSSKKIIAEKEKDHPADLEWNNGTTLTEQEDKSILIENYSLQEEKGKMTTPILLPWKHTWPKGIVMSPQNGNENISNQALNLETSSNILNILNGKILIEPTERLWTDGITVLPSYDYSYAIGVYDLRVSNSRDYSGIYTILNSEFVDTDRKWIERNKSVAIVWSDLRNCWIISRYSSFNMSDNTVSLTGDPLYTQFSSPFSEEWAFGTVAYNNRIVFPFAGTYINQCDGSSPVTTWENGNVEKIGDNLKLSGSSYIIISSNETILGNWSNGIQVLESERDLIVSGFSQEEVNGVYTVFKEGNRSDLQDRIWLKAGNTTKFSISYLSGSWKITTTADGIYYPNLNKKIFLLKSGTSSIEDISGTFEGNEGTVSVSFENTVEDEFCLLPYSETLDDIESASNLYPFNLKNSYIKSINVSKISGISVFDGEYIFIQKTKDTKPQTWKKYFYLDELKKWNEIYRWNSNSGIYETCKMFKVTSDTQFNSSKTYYKYIYTSTEHDSKPGEITLLKNPSGNIPNENQTVYLEVIEGILTTEKETFFNHDLDRKIIKISGINSFEFSYDLDGTQDYDWKLEKNTPNEPVEAIYETWTDIYGLGINNTICFDRCQDRYVLKNGKSLDLTFTKNSSQENASTVWSSNEYTLKYDLQNYCWKLFDSSNNILDCQMISPQGWEDHSDETNYEETVVEFDKLKINMAGAPFDGDYLREQFQRNLTPFSMKKEVENKTYYLVYNFFNFRWELLVKLELDGAYLLQSEEKAINQKIWKKSGTNFSISFDLDQKKWKIGDSNEIYYLSNKIEIETVQPLPTSGKVFELSLTSSSSTSETGHTISSNGTINYGTVDGMECATFTRSSYLSFSDSGFPFGTNARTLCCWFRCSNLPTSSGSHLFGYGDRYNGGRFCGIWLEQDRSIQFVGKGGDNNLSSPIRAWNYNQWHFVVATKSGRNEAIYLDGVKIAEGATNKNTSSRRGQIAWAEDDSSVRFEGSLAACRIFNRVLTEEEITQLYNEFTWKPIPKIEGEPEEGIWENGLVVIEGANENELKISESPSNLSDSIGVYALIADGGVGTAKKWIREGNDGFYRILWNKENLHWVITFEDKQVNGTYSLEENEVWTHTGTNNSRYVLSFNNDHKNWSIIKDGEKIISNSISTSYSTLGEGWSIESGSITKNEDGSLTLTGFLPSVNGTFLPTGQNVESAPDNLNNQWSKTIEETSSLFTIEYSQENRQWLIRETDLDLNGQYKPYGSGTGYDRKWKKDGNKTDWNNQKISYIIIWDEKESRWHIRRLYNFLKTQDGTALSGKEYYLYLASEEEYFLLEEGVHYSVGSSSTYPEAKASLNGKEYEIGNLPITDWFEKIPELSHQITGTAEPYSGEWSEGKVKDPFYNSSIYNVGVRFTPEAKQEFDYLISGASNPVEFNDTYTLEDANAMGEERVWRASNSEKYIKWFESGDYAGWVVANTKNFSRDDIGNQSNRIVFAWTTSNSSNKTAKNLSSLSWNQNSYVATGGWNYFSFSIIGKEVEKYGKNKPFYLMALYSENGKFISSNVAKMTLTVQPDDLTGIGLSLVGSSGSSDFTGFIKDSDGRFLPTDMITVKFSASSSYPIRLGFTGVEVQGISASQDFEYSNYGTLTRTGILPASSLGDEDLIHEISMTVKDAAGNERTLTKNITQINKLWRLKNSNIKEDSSGYSSKLYSVSSSGSRVEIQRTTILDDEASSKRSWNDIFYPMTHSYPLLDDGTIDKKKAIRISKSTIDNTGLNGPTQAELLEYDRFVLTEDGKDLAVDSEGRYITATWDRTKLYNPMESSSYGRNGENIKYWIIDNTGNSDFQLEFEYFDLSSQVMPTPKNPLSPYEGDVLVIYDASADGCIGESTDKFGRVTQTLADSSKLVELFAFTGSHYDENISMKADSRTIDNSGNSSSAQNGIETRDFGFVTPKITTTSKICMILYTDNGEERSGFKLKAGPSQSATLENYEINRKTGEVWIHRSPNENSNIWSSPNRVQATYSFTESNAQIDYDRARVTFDEDPGKNTIVGNLFTYSYLENKKNLITGEWESISYTPTSVYPLISSTGEWDIRPELKSFLLYNDDCVDYYDVSTYVVPNGISSNMSVIYDWSQEISQGKIVSKIMYNKDKGVVTFTERAPLGRLFSSYAYHTFYRLTNDGYGDLNFYENSLVPSSDYTLTGLKDFTWVDIAIVNEGSVALAEGLMKFLSRGYISGSGSSQTITQVVDENRPWDVQSGTVAETVNQTGARFSTTFTGLPDGNSRTNALSAISENSGGVSLGSSLAARSKAYIRIWWCLAKSVSGSNVTYVTTTRGKKLWSSEISGKYFTITV